MFSGCGIIEVKVKDILVLVEVKSLSVSLGWPVIWPAKHFKGIFARWVLKRQSRAESKPAGEEMRRLPQDPDLCSWMLSATA